jgi:hypothetical protein
MAANPVRVLSSYTQDFGDTFRFYLGGLKEAIVTIDPTVIQHVLKTNADGPFLGEGLAHHAWGRMAHTTAADPEGFRPETT